MRTRIDDSGHVVSVVVPVYNVGKALNHCIKSLVNQRYRKLDILLVDDGSTDGSSALCDRWAAKDPRIRVLHRVNRGVSAARNAGMDAAKGEWLMFVDGDDWLEPDAVEILMHRAFAWGSELVFCANWNDTSQEGVPSSRNTAFDIDVQTRDDFITWFGKLSDAAYVRAPWGKLFSMELVRRSGARFPEGVAVGEDSVFNFTVYALAERVSCVPEALYHYAVHPGSAMSSFNPRWFADRKYSYQTVLAIVERWNPGYANAQRLSFLGNVSIILSAAYGPCGVRRPCDRAERLRLLRHMVHDDAVAECIRHVTPRSVRDRMTVAVLHTGSVTLTAIFGGVMGITKWLKMMLHGNTSQKWREQHVESRCRA